jgi:hypothetical protein
MTMTHPTTIHAAPKVRRVRVYPRLSLAIRKRLTEYCARKGVAERDIIEDAILQYLDGSSDSAKVLGQLERLTLALDAQQEQRDLQHREFEMLSAAFGRYLRLWFLVHLPPDSEEKQQAGANMFKSFAARLADEFARGHRFVHDFPKVADKRPHAEPR